MIFLCTSRLLHTKSKKKTLHFFADFKEQIFLRFLKHSGQISFKKVHFIFQIKNGNQYFKSTLDSCYASCIDGSPEAGNYLHTALKNIKKSAKIIYIYFYLS